MWWTGHSFLFVLFSLQFFRSLLMIEEYFRDDMCGRLSHLGVKKEMWQGYFPSFLYCHSPPPAPTPRPGREAIQPSVSSSPLQLPTAPRGRSVFQVAASLVVMKHRGVTGTGAEGNPQWFLWGRKEEEFLQFCLARTAVLCNTLHKSKKHCSSA